MVCNYARLFSFMNKKEYITCSPSYSDGVESGQIAKGIKKEGPIYRLGVGRWAFRGGYSTVRWITHPSINICVNLLISQLIGFLTHLLIFSLTY